VASQAVDLSFLEGAASEVAPRLLGCILERRNNGRILRVRIVETEAYDQTDVASHSYNGRTPRTEVMFGPAGHLYVYFTYGMHYCCNIVVGEDGYGAAVLLRAVEPIDGIEYMEDRRGRQGIEATNGPAKLCQALGIDKSMNGEDLRGASLRLIPQPALPANTITTTTRIGITRGVDVPWRFYVTDSPYVSKFAK
jgi:DNA-3-methyladenine glycosylase